MRDSFFWRCIAVLGIVGLFYVGHGLNSDNPQLPSLIQTAKADGVALAKYKGKQCIVTSSPDGKTVYYFGPGALDTIPHTEQYLGKISAK